MNAFPNKVDEKAEPSAFLSRLPSWSHKLFIHLLHSTSIRPFTSLVALDENSKQAVSTTVVFRATDKESVEARLTSFRPGMKEVKELTCDRKGTNEIFKLGKLDCGSLPGWDTRKRTLPPCIKLQVFICSLRAARKVVEPSERKRQNRVVDGCECNASVVMRTLKLPAADVADFIAVTVTKEEHDHSCPEEKSHLARLSIEDRAFLLQKFLEHGTAEQVFKLSLAPLINAHDPQKYATPRLLALTQRDVEEFGRKYELENAIKPGEQDFKAVQTLLEQFREESWNVCYKFPGQDPFQTKGAAPYVPECLKTEDLFIFIQSPLQLAMLMKYGKCCATDGTHCILSYNRVKLISLHVASYDEADSNVVERGHNVGIALVTSEREDIHTAILSQVLERTGDKWTPSILMTDLAFGAYNAWKIFFPDVIWLWCVFHVWQAWKRKIDHLNRPDTMKAADHHRIKSILTREILTLISPKDERSFNWWAFDTRANNLRTILLGFGYVALARSWETYFDRKGHWAPPARRDAVDRVFGPEKKMPMLAKSNNSLERFHGVLKWVELKGTAASSLVAFLACWVTFLARSKVNALRANINLKQLLENAQSNGEPDMTSEDITSADADPVMDDNASVCSSSSEESASEHNNENLDVTNGEEREPDENIEMNIPDNQSQELISKESVNIVKVVRRNSSVALRLDPASAYRQKINYNLTRISNLSSIIDQRIRTGNSSFSTSQLQNLASYLTRVSDSIGALVSSSERFQTSSVGEIVIQPYRKQRENYGPDPDFETEEESITPKVVEESLTQMNREKRRRTDLEEIEEEETFEQLSARLLIDESFVRLAQTNSIAMHTERYSTLRSGLERNRVDRIHHIAHTILGLKHAQRLSKSDRIHGIITKIADLLRWSKDMTVALENTIADIGRAKGDIEKVSDGELVFIRANSTDSHGEPCVSHCEEVKGWICRGENIVEVNVRVGLLKWSRLHERLKTVDDLKG